MAEAQDMIVLITGATSGFGEATARRFARETGTRLVLAGRRIERLEALRNELNCPVHVVQLDIRDRSAVENTLSELPVDFRNVSVLINNAGLALGMEPADRASLDDWDTMIDTNCKGLVYCTRAILPGMVARNCGHVVNIGSIAGTYPYPGGNVYGGTKAFVRQFSLNLRAELLGTSIRVTNIEPGMAETEFSEIRFHGDKEKAKKVYLGMQPLTAKDIADTVYWCVSRPEHVNINTLEVMPTAQAPAGLGVSRTP